jgi:hypothetical protein
MAPTAQAGVPSCRRSDGGIASYADVRTFALSVPLPVLHPLVDGDEIDEQFREEPFRHQTTPQPLRLRLGSEGTELMRTTYSTQ